MARIPATPASQTIDDCGLTIGNGGLQGARESVFSRGPQGSAAAKDGVKQLPDRERERPAVLGRATRPANPRPANPQSAIRNPQSSRVHTFVAPVLVVLAVAGGWTGVLDRHAGDPVVPNTAFSRDPKGSAPIKNAGSVVVYCSVDIAFARPILDEFQRRTGIKVHPVFDTEAGKTTGLVSKLIAERRGPRADVWWSSEIFGTLQLASGGILAAYKSKAADDIPARYRHRDGLWTAFGLRGRVIAYDPARIKKEDLPTRWCDLIDGKYKGRFAMADPRFGTTRGHMATLLSLWGADAMADFYRALRANRYKRADGNAHAVLLLSRGMVDLVATDTDDVIVAQRRGDSIAMVYPDLDAPGGKGSLRGTLWMPCSVALVKGARHVEAAHRLIDYLLSAEIEERLQKSDSRNVPVRPGLRKRLGVTAPGEARADYAAAAAVLEQSDKLVSDVLLR
jgi:iron(III) transport system substrate-binding protein